MRAFLLLLTASVAIAAWAGRRQQSETVVLRLAHSLDVSHPVHRAMERMAERLSAESGGGMLLKIYPNSQLGSEREMIELVQLGAIDMVKTSTAPLEGFVPVMSVFGAPYVFRDEAHFWKVLEGDIGRELLEASVPKRLRGVCYYDAGSRSFYTRDRAIETPADLSGLKIRVQNSRTAIEMVKALGGSPTPIAFAELYSALEQDVVDGAENNPPSFLSSRHYEVCGHYALDEHTRVPDIVLIHASRWQSLSPEQQRWLDAAARDSAEFQRRLWSEKTEEALRTAREAGVQVTRPEKGPFQQAVQPLYEAFEGTEVGRLIERIRAVE